MTLRTRLNQIDELANERWLGISTAEWHQVHYKDRPDFRGYAPSSYRDWRVISRHIKPQGTFIDYGAGLGRVTILAARMPFARVIGLDLDPDLVKRGNLNISLARGLRCPASILLQDATTFQIPADASVLYFCNPFSGAVLASVLERIRDRDVQIICNLPKASAFENEIVKVPWLALRKELSLSDNRKCLIYEPQGY